MFDNVEDFIDFLEYEAYKEEHKIVKTYPIIRTVMVLILSGLFIAYNL